MISIIMVIDFQMKNNHMHHHLTKINSIKLNILLEERFLSHFIYFKKIKIIFFNNLKHKTILISLKLISNDDKQIGTTEIFHVDL